MNAENGAPGGSVVAVYGTGKPTGTIATIYGGGSIYSAVIEYAGPAPGLVSGVTQVNLRLPADFKASGFAVLYLGQPNVLIRGLDR